MNLRHQIINQVVRILRDIKSGTIWKINILTQIADGHRCEQWPFNLPFHRTGLTAQPEQRSNLTWEDEASTKIGFPDLIWELLLETIFGLLTGGRGGRTPEKIVGIHLTEIVLSIWGTGQANITLQIDFVISPSVSLRRSFLWVPSFH